MKIQKSDIAQKLKLIKSIVPPKAMASEAGILVKGNKLIANDLELAVIAKLQVLSDEEFVLPVAGTNLIESLPDEIIDISSKENKVTIKSSCGKSTFTTIFPEQFPEVVINENDCTDSITIDTENFVNSVSKVLFACNTAVAKAQLRGIYLDGDGEYLNIVASDGFRLAWDRIKCNNNFNCIVPKTALQKLISFDMGKKMEFCRYKNSKAVFKSDEYTVSTSLIDGSFIDYKSVFRATPQTRFEVNAKTMLGSISRSLIASEKSIQSPVILKRDNKREALSIHRNGSTYSFNEEMMSEFDNDKDILIGFNAKYLVECIKATEGDELLIDFIHEQSPLIVNDKQFKQIVLPVRLSERMREAIE